MKSFILNQHEKVQLVIRELVGGELLHISGGDFPGYAKLNIVTITKDHIGGDHGAGED